LTPPKMLVPLLLVLAIAWGVILYRGGRRRGSIVGGLLLGPLLYGVVGSSLAGHLNPAMSRFQPFPVQTSDDAALLFNIGFWIVLCGAVFYFLLPLLGSRWKT
jgi:hypothetical protein